MITQVNWENYKDSSGTQALTGFDLFIGDNGSGKSRILEAIPLTILGYVPTNGKNEAATFRFSSSDTQMGGGIVLDSGFSCVRRFIRTVKIKRKYGTTEVKISQDISFSPSLNETSKSQKQERLAREFGTFHAMFNFNEFLDLSGPERRKFIANLAPILTEKWNRSTVQAHLEKELLTEILKKNNLDQYKIMGEMITLAMSKYPESFSAQDGIYAILGWLSKEKDFWDDKTGDAEGVVRQLSEKKNESLVNERDLKKFTVERDLLQSELLQLEKKTSAGEERQKTINDRNNRIQELSQLITELENAEVSTDTSDIDELIRETREKLDNFDYSVQYNQLKDEGASKKPQAETLKAKYDLLVQRKQAFEAEFNAMKTAKEKIESSGGCCIVDPARKKCSEDFTNYMDFVNGKIVEGTQFVESINQEIEVAKQSYQLAETELKTIAESMQRTMESMSEANEKNRLINEQLSDLDRQRNDRLNAVKNRDEKVKFYQQELDPLKIAVQSESPLEDFVQMENRISEINNRLEALKTSIRTAEQAKDQLVTIQHNLLQQIVASTKSDCLDSIKDELGYKGILGEIVKEVVEPLRASMQEYLSLMGYDYPVFFETESETGQEVFWFGWLKNNRRIYFDTLSTAQKLIYLAALVTVISDRANPKLKVLSIDKLDDLDKYNFKLAMAGLAKLKPKYDNIILAGDAKGDLVFSSNWESLTEFMVGECKVWNLTPKEAANHGQKSA